MARRVLVTTRCSEAWDNYLWDVTHKGKFRSRQDMIEHAVRVYGDSLEVSWVPRFDDEQGEEAATTVDQLNLQTAAEHS